MAESRRKNYEMLRAQLESERSSFLPHWRDLGTFILPRRPRFFTSDSNKGDRRNSSIVDSTATLSSRTLRSGMMSGVTSPARPWFRITTPDPGLAEFGAVKEWLHLVSQRMSTVFLRSNLYNVLPVVYGDLGTFATGVMFVEEDLEDVMRFYPLPIGSYMLANDHKLKVNVFFREFRMTIRQLVQKFGKNESGKPDLSMLSQHVQDQWRSGNTETWIDVCHIIKPNERYDNGKLESKFKKFISCYYEKGSASNHDEDRFLSEKGYDFFPVLAPRWEVTGEDVYGTDCPGMTALGDVKALQLMHKRKAQAIEKMINPPMIAPLSLRNQKTTILPGDVTFSNDGREGGFRPAHEVNPRIQEILMDIQDHQKRIQRSYFEDLFLMLAQSDRRDITAREIDERHEEKLLALGPVLEQLNQDLLDPLIDIAFTIMLRQGMIPKPPQELAGLDLKVEYISIMAQAQKLVGLAGVERYARFAGQIASFNAESLDKTDMDQMLDVYSDITGIPPGIVRTDDQVAALRQSRSQAAQVQQRGEQMMQGSQTAKNLSETDTEGQNALTDLLKGARNGAPLQ